ncbi:efflux RND transporter periplasmic adaptor subunit [Glaciecola petra]|uniref:Efflux RND transporter periplasmic adaptor subunit n=1 Tax=Glaciecola petra TaxID=3075602 RepID=A0ABU2ZPV5_9ALTE|nr:efflux RND transporter periplasmic adaptor subunit [Aestuariibacter sp. P117]MDT0594663.1 efflux RND transporter periplasmic adaptor subunit [Aestuariibacter sp. P117]
MNKASISKHALAVGIGILLGSVGLYLIAPLGVLSGLNSGHNSGLNDTQQSMHSSEKDNEPLYWVAPMDPNFKRDKPGKSPMGMDLVPVFANELGDDSPGTVKIDPVTINNLGIKTTSVQMTTPKLSVRAIGKVAFAEDAIVHVHPRVEGWIETLAVRSKGEYVAKGEALYSLYSPGLVNAQEEFLIAIEQNNKALINAARLRLQALNAPSSLIKRIELDRKIERTITFNAPQNGYVNELNIQSGFYVKPSTTMLSIANMDKVWILADVFANDLSKIALGQSATVTSDYFPTKEITTELAYIYPTLDATTHTAKVRFIVDNSDLALKPDMFTSVDIQTYSQSTQNNPKVLAIPGQTIIRTGENNRVVLALGDGKFKSINVTLGRVFDELIEISSGLQEGDVIVSSAQFLIDSESSITSDFMRMRPAESPNSNDNAMGMEEDADISAWTSATVNEVMIDERMVNITHGPLDAFNMMGMTMNFMLADDIDMTQFATGIAVHVEVTKHSSGMYMLKTVHFMDKHTDEEMPADSGNNMHHETSNEANDPNHNGGH